jgi:hypothetical protein
LVDVELRFKEGPGELVDASPVDETIALRERSLS